MSTATTTIAVKADVIRLVTLIAEKRSEQLGFTISKGDIIRNLVMKEAEELKLVPRARPASVSRGPGPAKAHKDSNRPRRSER